MGTSFLEEDIMYDFITIWHYRIILFLLTSHFLKTQNSKSNSILCLFITTSQNCYDLSDLTYLLTFVCIGLSIVFLLDSER